MKKKNLIIWGVSLCFVFGVFLFSNYSVTNAASVSVSQKVKTVNCTNEECLKNDEHKSTNHTKVCDKSNCINKNCDGKNHVYKHKKRSENHKAYVNNNHGLGNYHNNKSHNSGGHHH